MNTGTHHDKVTAAHLRREAYLYVRQSTLQQVLQNTESTRRQYARRRRAVALGWPEERIIVTDSDLARSGLRGKIVKAFSGSSAKSAPVAPASSWGSRSLGWQETPATGTGCWLL